MKSIWKNLILTFLVFASMFVVSAQNYAQEIKLPSSVMTVDDIIEEFRGVFKTKIVDLGKNYITEIYNNSIIFKNSLPTECHGSKISIENPVASMVYSSALKKNDNPNKYEMSEKTIYRGCGEEISLIEDVITVGHDLKIIDFDDFSRGKRSFDLKENEVSRIYRVSNGEGQEIFRVVIERRDKIKTVNFYYIGNQFLSISYSYRDNATMAIFTVYSYIATYARRFSSWKSESHFAPFNFSVLAEKRVSNTQINYFDHFGEKLSLAVFLDVFSKSIMNKTIANLRDIFDYHTKYFPATSTTNTGAQSQRMMEELRMAQSRLLNNTELNLVRNFIQNLINATELGQIVDKRPRDQQ